MRNPAQAQMQDASRMDCLLCDCAFGEEVKAREYLYFVRKNFDKKLCSIIGMIISIVLMALLKGIPMTFAPNPNETVTSYCSYFNPMPFGYGNWFPIITAILSICVVVLLVIDLKKDCKKSIKVCLGIAIFATLLSWFIFNAFSFIGFAVLALHIFIFIIQILPRDAAK